MHTREKGTGGKMELDPKSLKAEKRYAKVKLENHHKKTDKK